MQYVWVVTYWDTGSEPVVTVFNNPHAANMSKEFFEKHHDGVCVDHVPIYCAWSAHQG